MPFLIIILFLGIFIAFAILGHMQAKKRTSEMEQCAHSLGLKFSGDKDYSLDERYNFINKLCQGSSRYGFNIMHGTYKEHPVMVFDYHYETHSTDSKGRRRTHHHYFSFFMLHFEQSFPELLISKEGWLSKIAQFLGFDDIDFESAEFSRRFKVKSPDKKFAYDICHGKMIEYLLQNPDLSIEIERHCLTLFFGNRLSADQIRPNLNRLIRVRELFPSYLFDR